LKSNLFTNAAIYSAIVLVDKTKFGQVIRNLLSKAITFTPPGGSITVTATVDQDRSVLNTRAVLGSLRPKRLELEIRDTGEGISQVL